MGRLALLFIVLPATELALLIEIGRRIGTLETFALIVVTGVVGAALARTQGLRVLSHVQAEVALGRMPAESLLDGLMILVAAALLVTPGVLTDVFGFLCLAPAFRRVVKRAVVKRFEETIRAGNVEFHASGTGPGAGPGWPPQAPRREIDVTPPRPPE